MVTSLFHELLTSGFFLRKLVRYFLRIDNYSLAFLHWHQLRRLGKRLYILGVLRGALFVIVGFLLSPILFLLSLFRSIEIWKMALGPDKASHFIDGIEMHLRRNQLENKKKSIKIVVWPQKFPNEALAKLYRTTVYIIGPKQKFFAKVLPFVLWKVVVINHSVNSSSIASQKIINYGKQSLSFSSRESHLGNELSSQLCSDDHKEFVLLGLTSSTYRSYTDQKYHPKDDLISAIPDPLNFTKVIEKLKVKGIGFVRQGLHLEEVKELSRVGLIVPNYEKFPSGFPDVWLAANCKFLLSACTGSWWFGLPFNKPSIITDVYTPLGMCGLKSNLLIFQIPWNLKEERFEDFAWMMTNPRWCYDQKKLHNDFTNIKNSPDQIVDVVYEQLARLDRSWVETDEDGELQQRFQRLVWGKDADPAYLPRLGAKFLREHQNLLPR